MTMQPEATQLNAEDHILTEARQLHDARRFEDVEKLLTRGRALFPESRRLAEEWSLIPMSLREYETGVDRLYQITKQFPDSLQLNQHLFGWLCQCQRLSEAEEVLPRLEPLAVGTSIWLKAKLRLFLEQGKFEEASIAAGDLRSQFPDDNTGYTLGGQALRKIGRFQEAYKLLSIGLEKFGEGVDIEIDLATIEAAMSKWQQALDRLARLHRRWPDFYPIKMALGETLELWRHATIENDPNALTVVFPEDFSRIALIETDHRAEGTSEVSAAEVMMRFEGLGCGCEFGLVQRKFGAEPLGLLRWAMLDPNQLCTMLENRLAGVGEEENSFIKVHGDEYFIGDTRYFAMHSFTKISQISQSDMFAKSTMRMRYLKDELLSDLDEGNKIFVYKPATDNLSSAEINKIFSCFQDHYPSASIVIAHKAANLSETGTIRRHGSHLFEAFLDRINAVGDLISFQVWLGLCRELAALDR